MWEERTPSTQTRPGGCERPMGPSALHRGKGVLHLCAPAPSCRWEKAPPRRLGRECLQEERAWAGETDRAGAVEGRRGDEAPTCAASAKPNPGPLHQAACSLTPGHSPTKGSDRVQRAGAECCLVLSCPQCHHRATGSIVHAVVCPDAASGRCDKPAQAIAFGNAAGPAACGVSRGR
ncbi:hypothetical protein BDY17DRAFT_100837 [Neohortaea acidophila]|uniref:Uncharacterized protein n=1 Tax=Neohortaea acidophila TaxID=245834 RepID=A0A6A6PZX1_9PEZI|nr:uncharacterized protein BDY17DRAFT_100837 [Neohortaea acidophila]KAF2485321.1 hypothetical protein BDY17DRAFT_100837 [Neohortaea acidophila]